MIVKLTNSRLAMLRAAQADGVYVAGLPERKAVNALIGGGLVTCLWNRYPPRGRMRGNVRITPKGRRVLREYERKVKNG